MLMSGIYNRFEGVYLVNIIIIKWRERLTDVARSDNVVISSLVGREY